MSEMRECWFNVYGRERNGAPFTGAIPFRSRSEAWMHAQSGVAFRIHVRLKPEGAPRRYASESERRGWEIDPTGARFAARHGFSLRNRVGSGVYLVPPRTPKIEESAK
jgi:hypothetical protein